MSPAASAWVAGSSPAMTRGGKGVAAAAGLRALCRPWLGGRLEPARAALACHAGFLLRCGITPRQERFAAKAKWQEKLAQVIVQLTPGFAVAPASPGKWLFVALGAAFMKVLS